MDQVIKAKWVAALREPGRKQIRNSLHTDEGFCCLGVLCDIRDPNKWTLLDEGDEAPFNVYSFGGTNDGYGMPPNEVTEWAGFSIDPLSDAARRHIPYVEIDGIVESLHRHNDHGKTFAQIADAIEAQL